MALAINIDELINGKVIFETNEQCTYFLTVLPVNPKVR